MYYPTLQQFSLQGFVEIPMMSYLIVHSPNASCATYGLVSCIGLLMIALDKEHKVKKVMLAHSFSIETNIEYFVAKFMCDCDDEVICIVKCPGEFSKRNKMIPTRKHIDMMNTVFSKYVNKIQIKFEPYDIMDTYKDGPDYNRILSFKMTEKSVVEINDNYGRYYNVLKNVSKGF